MRRPVRRFETYGLSWIYDARLAWRSFGDSWRRVTLCSKAWYRCVSISLKEVTDIVFLNSYNKRKYPFNEYRQQQTKISVWNKAYKKRPNLKYITANEKYSDQECRQQTKKSEWNRANKKLPNVKYTTTQQSNKVLSSNCKHSSNLRVNVFIQPFF